MTPWILALFAWTVVAPASTEPWVEGTNVRAPRTAAGWIQGAYAPGPARYFFGDLDVSLPFGVHSTGRHGWGAHVGVSGTHWSVPAEERAGVGLRNVNAELWKWFGNPEKATAHGLMIGYGTRFSSPLAGYLLAPVENAHRLYFGYDGYIDWDRFDLGYLLRLGLNDRTLVEMTADISAFYELNPQFAVGAGFFMGISPTLHFMPGLRWRPPLAPELPGIELALTAAIPSYLDTFRAERTAALLQVKVYDR